MRKSQCQQAKNFFWYKIFLFSPRPLLSSVCFSFVPLLQCNYVGDILIFSSLLHFFPSASSSSSSALSSCLLHYSFLFFLLFINSSLQKKKEKKQKQALFLILFGLWDGKRISLFYKYLYKRIY